MIALIRTLYFFNYGCNFFLYLKWNILTTALFDKTKNPPYCYEVFQQEVPKIWIVCINFSIVLSLCVLTLNM